MNKKIKPDNRGYVYSTDPGFRFEGGGHPANETLDTNKQKLLIRMDTAHRAGKAVTLVEGFVGKEEDLENLGKKLKTICGTGGSVKDGTIIIQGDQRDKILSWLIKNNYTSAKKK